MTAPSDHICPEHVAGKPWNCPGWAIDENDDMVPCAGAGKDGENR